MSGASGLAQSHGVPYYLHPRDAIYPYDGTPGQLEYQALEDGTALRIGRSVVRVVHNPGHTEGSVTYLVDDAVALTGDFLFVASVGRPDLAGKTKEWTGELWRSIEKAKRSWPKDLWICPGHYGSESDRGDNGSVCAQFGELLRDNEALTRPNSQAFAEWVESQVASFPDSYRKIKAINVGLVMVDELEAEELEVGRNECALGGP